MNHREVMQQALEALEHADGWIATRLPNVNDAIDALRAALAEQCHCGDRPAAECPGEWEPGCDLGANEAHVKVHEPQEEPVAWMYPDDYERMVASETWVNVFSVQVGSPTQGKTTVPLYTHPAPQRQPLSDAEVYDLYRAMVKGGKSMNWLCRAIERAHGIGGEE